MDSLTLALFVTKIILINAKNLNIAIQKAKADDGKVSVDELSTIAFDTALKSLDDMLKPDSLTGLASLLKGKI